MAESGSRRKEDNVRSSGSEVSLQRAGEGNLREGGGGGEGGRNVDEHGGERLCEGVAAVSSRVGSVGAPGGLPIVAETTPTDKVWLRTHSSHDEISYKIICEGVK